MKLQKRLKVEDEYPGSLLFLRRFSSGLTREQTQANQRIYLPLNKMRKREIFKRNALLKIKPTKFYKYKVSERRERNVFTHCRVFRGLPLHTLDFDFVLLLSFTCKRRYK